jgi:hypothetical protein
VSAPGDTTLRALPGSTGKPPPILKHPWRVAIVVGALLVVANLFVFLLSQADTKREGRVFPVSVDTVYPLPGELLRPQDEVAADLRSDLTGVLLIDGVEVPEDQLDRTETLGIVRFKPGPDKDIDAFEPGPHTAVVQYWSQGKARPVNPRSYSWSFRVGA